MKVRYLGEMDSMLDCGCGRPGSEIWSLLTSRGNLQSYLTTVGFSFFLRDPVQLALWQQLIDSRAAFLIGEKITEIRFERDSMKYIAMPDELVWKQLSWVIAGRARLNLSELTSHWCSINV